MTDCIFCKIINKEIPSVKIYEDDKTFAFLDINPANQGHTLIIPKQHAELLIELDDDYAERIMKTAKLIDKKLRKGLKCEAITLALSDGKQAGQEVPHVHLHLIPRYSEDKIKIYFPSKHKATKEELEKTAEKIRRAI